MCSITLFAVGDVKFQIGEREAARVASAWTSGPGYSGPLVEVDAG